MSESPIELPSVKTKGTVASPEETDDFLRMPGHLLRRCQQIGVAIFLDECRELDLTPLQFSSLASLHRFGPMDQVTLGRVTALDRTTVVVVINKLEKRGLVSRKPSSKDKRAKIVVITAQGRAILKQALPKVLQVQRRILMPLDAGERRLLISLLEKMAHENNDQSRAPHRLPRVSRA